MLPTAHGASLFAWSLVLLVPVVAVLFAAPFSWFTKDQTQAVRTWITATLKAPAGNA